MHAIRQICLGGLIVALGSFLSPLALGEWSDFVRSAKDAHKHRELRTVDEVDGKKVEQVERTVYVSFLVGKDWRTVSYDSAELPKEFERVMLLIGERFETKKRLKP